jgi:hypothetical protein
MQSPFPASSVAQAETSKKRKSKPTSQDKETPKEVEEEEREVHHSPQREFSSHPAPELEEVPSLAKTTTKKGRKLYFPSPTAAAETRVRRPFTRSSTHKENVETEITLKFSIPNKAKGKSDIVEKSIEVMTKTSVQTKDKGKGEATENPIEVVNISSPLDNPTFKRLIRQLRDARKEVSHLKEQRLTERRKLKELMDMYNETLDMARFTTRIFFPLHRQLKTMYRQNRSIQSQNKNLKEELQPFKDDLAHRNLNVLAQAGIEINAPAVDRSAPEKERDVDVIEGSSPTTRRSARLRR